MLGSNFFEALVKKDNTEGKAIATVLIGIALTLLCLLLSFITRFYLLLLPATAAGFATVFLYRRCNIEYEYVIAEDELAITKIIGQSQRKPMVTTMLSRFTDFGKLSEAPNLSSSATLVLACAAEDENAYYCDFPDENLGTVRLVITPDDRFLTYFSKHLPRNIRFSYTPNTSNSEDFS